MSCVLLYKLLLLRDVKMGHCFIIFTDVLSDTAVHSCPHCHLAYRRVCGHCFIIFTDVLSDTAVHSCPHCHPAYRRVCGLCAVAVRISSDVPCIYVLQEVSCKLGRTFMMQTGQPLQINEYFLSSWFRHSHQWNTQDTRAICGDCIPQSVQRSS